MLDRTVAPSAAPIKDISIPLAQKETLTNGIPLYKLNIANQDAVKIDLILRAGVVFETVAGTSYLSSKMLLEGTSKFTSSAIAEKLDYYGAFVEINSGFDYLTCTIYTLNRFASEVLQIIKEVLTDSIWPEQEFELVKKIKLQELRINNEKSNIVASKQFRHNLYGHKHPYGTILIEDEVARLTRDVSFDFYQSTLLNQPQIIVCGKVDETVTEAIRNAFGDISIKDIPHPSSDFATLKEYEVIQKEGMQSSIRIGQHTLTRDHPDIHLLAVTNSIFGGYFGSRLMKNIREDKGYTYGIYSSIAHLQDAAFQVISADVKREFTQQTIDEIFKELKTLQTELVPESELQAATNYLLGQFLSSLDSPFNIATKFKSALLANVDYGYYYDYINTLKTITPQQVLETAQKYLKQEDMIQVIVGDLN